MCSPIRSQCGEQQYPLELTALGRYVKEAREKLEAGEDPVVDELDDRSDDDVGLPEESELEESGSIPTREPQRGDYVVIEFIEKRKVHYVAKITSPAGEEVDFDVDFLRKSQKVTAAFVEPHVRDNHTVSSASIVAVPHHLC